MPAVVAVADSAVAVGAAPAASAWSVVTCKTRVYAGGPVYVTSARNLTCRQAKRQQARDKWTGKNSFTTPGGYRCGPSGRGAVGYQIRCVKASKIYRIEFQD
jgi:hypothetical protein